MEASLLGLTKRDLSMWAQLFSEASRGERELLEVAKAKGRYGFACRTGETMAFVCYGVGVQEEEGTPGISGGYPKTMPAII